jgi:glucose/arabinose dehydrogenase
VLTLSQPYRNHNGGAIAFGPDGLLYIGTGDGGSSGDPGNRAQDRFSPLGKILRLDVDNGDPYAVPADNPFADGENGHPLVWGMGLRNPWRISFDRRGGALWIADIGERRWEEINRVGTGPRRPALPNFGWKAFEGRESFAPQPLVGRTISPLMVYSHTGGRCSVTGGYVYRGAQIRYLRGRYVFGDRCTGQLWYLNVARKRMIPLPQRLPRVTTFGENARGELWAASGDGRVVRLVR